MQIQIEQVNLGNLSAEDRQRINQVLLDSPSATVFHTIEWNQLLASEFELQNITLLATQGGTPVGLYSFCLVANHLWRSPAVHLLSVYGGPICTRDDARVISELLKAAERLQPVAAFQIWTPPNYDISAFARLGYLCEEMYTPILSLHSSEEELWAKLHQRKRTTIRKASKNGVVVVDGDLSTLDEYYEMVTETLGRGGIDPLPRSYRKQVLQELGPKGMADLLLAKHNGETIAGEIVLYYKDTATAWDMGWQRESASLSPSDLLFWESMKRASQKGCKYYDIPRFEPDRLPSIAKWKEAFGPQVVSCYYLSKATLGYRLWRGMQLLMNPKKIWTRLHQILAGQHAAH